MGLGPGFESWVEHGTVSPVSILAEHCFFSIDEVIENEMKVTSTLLSFSLSSLSIKVELINVINAPGDTIKIHRKGTYLKK